MLAKSGLLDITMKTAELIRSNQQAKNELMQLKAEIDQFVQNVLANPENQVKSRPIKSLKEIHLFCYSATTSAPRQEQLYIQSSQHEGCRGLPEGVSDQVSLHATRTQRTNVIYILKYLLFVEFLEFRYYCLDIKNRMNI